MTFLEHHVEIFMQHLLKKNMKIMINSEIDSFVSPELFSILYYNKNTFDSFLYYFTRFSWHALFVVDLPTRKKDILRKIPIKSK